jgi:hypothetical protein
MGGRGGRGKWEVNLRVKYDSDDLTRYQLVNTYGW